MNKQKTRYYKYKASTPSKDVPSTGIVCISIPWSITEEQIRNVAEVLQSRPDCEIILVIDDNMRMRITNEFPSATIKTQEEFHQEYEV